MALSLGQITGGIAAVAGVAGAVSSFKAADAQKKQAEAMQQANRLAGQAKELQAARQRRQSIRELRIQQARNQAQGVAQGVSGSSIVAGIQGALNTNFASALSYLDQQSAISSMQQSFLDQAHLQQAQASVFGSAASLGFTGMRLSAGIFQQTPEFRELVKKIS